ncbi:hypothetical protein IJG11_02885 [Candidatus Saccharibacteria bacterium]|nr:hypothetical protein [Candidatus Saccharibacteria bacterium]
MSAEETLRSSERSALNNNQFVSHVTGKNSKIKSTKKLKSWGAAGFITAMIILVAVVFSAGNIIPTTIYEGLIEETDMQCADMTASKNLAFQQALESGEIPDGTAEILKRKGILVGYVDNNGEFVEDNNEAGTSLSLKKDGEIISAGDFMDKVGTDISLYSGVNDATYRCAAYYYDEDAYEVFDEIGTKRNNFTSEDDFSEKMNTLMGDGSNININSVSLVQKTETNSETGETETYYEYVENGTKANSGTDATDFIEVVKNKNSAADTDTATLNAADQLKVADTTSREQRSSLFFALFMENVSKMKAGDGSESKLNDAMNYLYDKEETEVVDVKTGKVTKVTGTALDSPSLYAILSGNKVDTEAVENYSNERILKTVENQVNTVGGSETIENTVASVNSQQKGSIGRFIEDGIETASSAILSLVEPTVNSSLVDNSYETIKGVDAGEMLVEGAVVVGSKLAKRSGATAGDAAAVDSYARLNNKIVAMNAEEDRLNRSPFDITSKNTFLGSIIYKFAIGSAKIVGNLANVRTFSTVVSNAVASLLPVSYADASDGYLTTFGDCETYATIGAVGSAQCAEIATFDTSTLNNPFNDPGFIEFVNNNTTLTSSGVRKINEGSTLADFIIYNNERKTPLGVTDGGILDSINKDSNSVSFVSDILRMIEVFLGSSDQDKRVASGEAFVNSSANPDWQTYKYAQRYVSLARATSALRRYADDKTAYTNLKFFEGEENPVLAFIEQYNKTLANK